MKSKAKKAGEKSEEQKGKSIAKNGSTESDTFVRSPTNSELSIQQKVGNHALKKLLESKVIQAKLEIGQPDDECEREADRLAEYVLRIPETQKERQEGQVELRTNSSSGENQKVNINLESRINAARNGGQPLPEDAREFFESRFGHDYSGVRVHADSTSDKLNQELGARAFTIGKNIFFREGQYRLHNEQGKLLLAHELAHVVQQNRKCAGAQLKNTIMRNNDDFLTEYNLNLTFDEDFDNFQEQVVRLIGSRVMYRSRDRATGLVRNSNLWSVHQQLLAARFRTGREHVIHASLSWTGTRVEAVTFSLQVEHIDFGPVPIRSRLHIYDILNNPALRAHFEAQYRAMAAHAREWMAQHRGLHEAAARATERHALMGEWIMRNYPQLRADNDPMLRRWFYESGELLERRPGESNTQFNQRVRNRVDAYISSVNARYRRDIVDAHFRECAFAEGECSAEGRAINDHMTYLRRTYGAAPW